MADITMCKGKDCPLKKTCYRYKASPNRMQQSYFVEVPFNKKEETNEFVCEYYWKYVK